MSIRLLGLMLFCSAICSACVPSKDVDSNRSGINALEQKIKALETRIATLETIGSRREKVSLSDLQPSLRQEIQSDPLNQSALLPVGGNGYSIAWTSHGPVAVMLKDIGPLGSGTRATLEFINMTAVDWTGVSLEVQYDNWNVGDSIKDEVEQETKGTKKSISQDLESRIALVVTVDLPGMTHESVRNISVSLSVNGIGYKKRNK